MAHQDGLSVNSHLSQYWLVAWLVFGLVALLTQFSHIAHLHGESQTLKMVNIRLASHTYIGQMFYIV